MPVHLSENGLTVLDTNGKPVPGGEHKTHAEALAHEQGMNIGLRREEGKPVAPKLGKGIRLPNGEFDAQKSPVDEADPLGYVGEEYQDGPKPRDKKSSFLVDPSEDELYVWLTEDETTPRWAKGAPPYVDRDQGDILTDRAFYHHSPERYQYRPAPDWNDDTTALPDAWVRAHPFGSPYKKDAHEEYFDRKTDYHDDDLTSVPVTYYHNYTPEGQPSGEPTAIGKTIAREYRKDGRWDKVRFNRGMDPEIKTRIAKAMKTGTLRASPTVVPDFHKVDDRTGHIDDWLTGSIAVLDARGERQPANQLAIGIPAMKALFKQARIPFPAKLETLERHHMQKSMKGGRFVKARSLLKALLKVLGDEEETPEGEAIAHSHEHEHKAEEYDGHPPELGPEGRHEHEHEPTAEHHGEHEEDQLKAYFEDSNPEDSAAAMSEGALGRRYWTNQFNGPQTDRDRYDGGTNFQKNQMSKDVQGLPQEEQNIRAAEAAMSQGNELRDPDIRLDWQPQAKAMKMMKAQVQQLQHKADDGDFAVWFGAQLQAGKVLPAERDEVRAGYLQALTDDRTMHPMMKSANGGIVPRVQIYQRSIERRQSRFGGPDLTFDQMKALGYQVAGLDQTDTERKFDEKRRQELLGLSAVGAKILQDEKKK
jgi:hypothetical protein